MKSRVVWGAKWVQRGPEAEEYILNEKCLPKLFLTRKLAREWIEQRYGYIRLREDLRHAPHFWRMPKATRFKVCVVEENQRGRE